MFVTGLQLLQFRNYAELSIPLHPGVTIFQGPNGQGKTNLVEAVEYLSRLGSHRVSSDIPLVQAGCDQAIIRAQVQAGADDERRLAIDVEINAGKANRCRVNRALLPKATDVVGVLRTVVFSPEDLAIVKGDPATRRRFIDEVVVSRWPRMIGVKQDYERVLKQRNTLLKSLNGRVREEDRFTIEIWDDQLVRLGSELLAARLDCLHDIAEPMAASYSTIAPVNNRASAAYLCSFGLPEPGASLEDAFRAALEERRAEEVRRGLTLLGPHRDDIALNIGDLPAKGYASHGESWSLALALRLGTFQLLRADGVEAVLILDDVFAELDATRRERLAAAVNDAEQLLITAAVPEDVPALLSGHRYQVKAGTVTVPESNAGADDE